MEGRKRRFNEAYDYLHNHHQIFIHEDLAKALGYSRSKISLALQGYTDALTPKFLRKLCEKYPFFSYDYLMYGSGELLLPQHQPIPRPEGVQVDSVKEIKDTHTLFSLAMELIKENEALHRQLQASIAELRSIIDRYAPIIESIEAERKTKKSTRHYPTMVAEDHDKSDGKN